MDVLSRVIGEREKNEALHREANNTERGCRAVEAAGRHWTLDGGLEDRTSKRREVR